MNWYMRLILLGSHTTNRAKNMRKATWKYAIAAALPSGVLVAPGKDIDNVLAPSVSSAVVLVATTVALYLGGKARNDRILLSSTMTASASVRVVENEVIESWSGSREAHREMVSCVIWVVTEI